MDIQITTQAVRAVASDALVVGAARKTAEKGILLSTTAATIDGLLDGLINELATNGEFKGGLGEILTIHTMSRLPAKRVIVVGLGAQEKITSQSIRRASSIVARHL